MTTVQEPTRELQRLATRIHFGLGRYLAARGNGALNSRWEAPRHGWTLSNLALRHAEATLALAKTDMVLASSAWVTARAAVEATGRCLWLLEPDDEWEREARWLVFLEEGARLGGRPEMKDCPQVIAQSESIEDFRRAVFDKLPEGASAPKRIESITTILAANDERLASFYVTASQHTHAAELATRTSRANLGVDATYGESVGAEDWLHPLTMSYVSFRATATRLIQLHAGEPPEILSIADRQIEEACDEFLAAVLTQDKA